MKYSIVIPTYNHCDDLLKPCIDSIFKYTDVTDIELIISANGCIDNTFEYCNQLRQKYDSLGLYDNLKIVWNDPALGYSRACNAGIEVATTDLIVLLNNDTVLLPQERNRWVEQLARPFTINDKCGISCLIKSESEPAGHDFAIFFCVMIHRKVFDKIGLLSLDYGAGGGEDTEFSIECERAGFEVIECVEKSWSSEAGMYCGDFPIYHVGEGTVHDKNLVPDWDDIFWRNSVTLAKKYNPNWHGLQNMKDYSFLKYKDKVLYKEVVEDNYYDFTAENLQNKVVIDIGANIGVASIFAAALGAKKVIAVEPTNATFQLLKDNIAQAKYENIVPLCRVASDVTGRAVKINHSASHQTANNVYDVAEQYDVVESISIADLVKMAEGSDVVLKLDCEGSEFDIIMNATAEDLRSVKKIAMEVHSDIHPQYKDRTVIETKLRSLGYEPVLIQPLYYFEYDNRGNLVRQSELPYCKQEWKKVEPKLIDLSFLKEQDAAMHREVIEANQYHLSPEKVKDRIVIDIGANIGAFSLYAAALGAKKVIAVEPISASYNTFLKNIHRTGLKNITTYKKIVAEKGNEFLPVSLNDNAGANSMYNVTDNYEVVETITFAEIMDQIAGHDILLKLDCEGGEYDVIMNATPEIMVRINEIMMEIHTDLHPKYKGKQIIEEKLRGFNFNQLDSTQIYFWDFDQNGKPINHREAPFVNQHWKK